MPSTNKTANLKLNQWVETDRPMRNDFNSDNLAIDTAIGNHVNNSAIHVTAEEKRYLKDLLMTYIYTGTGEASKTVTLTESFRYIAVFASGKVLSGGYSAMGYVGLGASVGLSVSASGEGFTVSGSLNENGVQYKVVMIK